MSRSNREKRSKPLYFLNSPRTIFTTIVTTKLIKSIVTIGATQVKLPLVMLMSPGRRPNGVLPSTMKRIPATTTTVPRIISTLPNWSYCITTPGPIIEH